MNDTNNVKKRESRLNILDTIQVMLIIFSILYICKLNGNFDFSRKFDIESIKSVNNYPDLQLMLDGELETFWSPIEGGYAVGGNYLGINFVNKKNVKCLIMQSNAIPCNLKIAYTDDEENIVILNECNFESGVYWFNEPVQTKTILIFLDAPEDHICEWSIKELEFVFDE